MLTFLSVAISIYACYAFLCTQQSMTGFRSFILAGYDTNAHWFFNDAVTPDPVSVRKIRLAQYHHPDFLGNLHLDGIFVSVLLLRSANRHPSPALYANRSDMDFKPLNKLDNYRRTIITGVLALSFLLSYGLFEARQIQVEKIIIASPKLGS